MTTNHSSNSTSSKLLLGGVIEVQSPAPNPVTLNDPALLKLAEQGGFIASILVLCLFFSVLTRFVKQVKDD